jgi:iron(III) transport system substrate-binding protein
MKSKYLFSAILFFCVVVLSASARADWKQDWEKTIAAAEKEGEVTLYGQARVGVNEALNEFSKVYPKIHLNFVGGQGSELGKKVMAEKRADKHLVDIAVGGGGTMVLVYHKAGLLQPMSSAFILPEVADASLWWEKKHHYADPDNRTVFMAQGDVDDRMGAYNKNLVKGSEIQSWWDVLEPRWRGKIVMSDPKWAGNIGTWRYFYYSPQLGPKFLRRLLEEARPVFSTDERLMVDWVGSGKYAMYLLAKDENIALAIKQGLPIDTLRSQKDGGLMTTGSGHLAYFKNPPHPNAAKVYVNWFLSKQGQNTWQKYTLNNSLRTDIPKDMLPRAADQVPKEGRTYFVTSLPQYEDIKPLRKLVDEVLAKRGN